MILDEISRELIEQGFHVPSANYFGLMNPTPTYMAVLAEALVAALNPQLATQNQEFLGALRRDAASGAMQLVSIRTGAFLRLSDFVNEYDFADFTYQSNDAFRGVHQQLRTDEGYPDLAARAAP